MGHLYIPFLVIVVLICIRFVLLWLLPETAQSLQRFESVPNDDQASHAQSEVLDEPHQSFGPEEDHQSPNPGATKITEPRSRTLKSILELIQRPQLQFCFLAILFKRVAFSSETLLYQYASDVLNTQLSHTAWLRALQAVGATFITGVGVPLLMEVLKRDSRRPTSSSSFVVVQGSLAILVIGFISLWLGRHPVIVGIGTSGVA